MHVKLEQWARLAPRLAQEKVVKGILVRDYKVLLDELARYTRELAHTLTYMRLSTGTLRSSG